MEKLRETWIGQVGSGDEGNTSHVFHNIYPSLRPMVVIAIKYYFSIASQNRKSAFLILWQ